MRQFEERNYGAMLIVEREWIYWPGVLRWRSRHGGRGRGFEGTGVSSLIRRIKGDRGNPLPPA